MEIRLPVGEAEIPVEIPTSRSTVFVARNRQPKAARSWEVLVNEALENPVNSVRLSEKPLQGKKIALLVDDKTRPTPAYKIAPIVLSELKKAGANEQDIRIVVACGLHGKMKRGEIKKKLQRNN